MYTAKPGHPPKTWVQKAPQVGHAQERQKRQDRQSKKQAIAIGLSEARAKGKKVPSKKTA